MTGPRSGRLSSASTSTEEKNKVVMALMHRRTTEYAHVGGSAVAGFVAPPPSVRAAMVAGVRGDDEGEPRRSNVAARMMG